MSEELTKAIRDEVVLFLKDSLRERERLVHYGTTLNGGTPSPTWALVDAEVRGLIEAYVEGGKPKASEPEPGMIEVGDLVRLTGRLWGKAGSEEPAKGEVYAVVAFDSYEHPIFYGTSGVDFCIGGSGWEAEVFKKSSEIEASEL